MTNRLYLLRHARACWAEPGSNDYERPLAALGKEDADHLGATMAANGYRPELVLCSSARRARETWVAVAAHLAIGKVEFTDDLYNREAAFYLDLIRQSGKASAILVIGHNPMMEDLAMALSNDGKEAAMADVARGFPTCGLAVLRFPVPLTQITPGSGYLEAFLTPCLTP